MMQTTQAPNSSFTHKQIAVTFFIDNPDGTTDTLHLRENFRVSATIDINALGAGSNAQVEIWGMTQSDMNRLSFISNVPNVNNPKYLNQTNTRISLWVGNYDGNLQNVYRGYVATSYTDYNDAQPVFRVFAQTVTMVSDRVESANSFQGAQKPSSLLSYLCNQAGLSFVSHGGFPANSVLHDVYLTGTLWDKLNAIAKATGAMWHFEMLDNTGQNTGYGTVHFWGPRFEETEVISQIPTISSATGLIGYPQYSAHGMSLQCLLRPEITFNSVIDVQSDYIPTGWKTDLNTGMNSVGQQINAPNKPWDGRWLVVHIMHQITSEMYGGPWYSYLECQPTSLVNSPVIGNR